MRTFFTFVLLFLAVSFLQAQAPQGINYQGVARNGSGSPLTNKIIYLYITILKDSPTGIAEYKEKHQVTTNAQGLFNLTIGGGSLVTGQFSAINWSAGKKFTKIEMSTDNVNFLLMGVQQLLSVPYSLFSSLPWVTTSNNIYYTKGAVGIGTIGPANSLLQINSNNTSYQFAQLRITGFSPRIDLDYAGKTKWRLVSLDNKNFALENQSLGTAYTQPLVISPVGNVGIGTDHATPLGAKLHLHSNNMQEPQLRITGYSPRIDLDFAGKTNWRLVSADNGDFVIQNWPNSSPVWLKPNGNLGIGTTLPSEKLTVQGTIQSTSGGFKFPDGTLQTTASTNSVWSASNSNISYTGGVVGIGTSTPSSTKLHIHSDNTQEPQVRLTGYSPRIDLDFPGNNNWRMVSATNGNFAIQHWPYSSPFWINPSGNVGIGVELPRAKVHVKSGDIYLEDATKGVIMKSPDGSCWRMTVSNAGAPVFTKIACP